METTVCLDPRLRDLNSLQCNYTTCLGFKLICSCFMSLYGCFAPLGSLSLLSWFAPPCDGLVKIQSSRLWICRTSVCLHTNWTCLCFFSSWNLLWWFCIIFVRLFAALLPLCGGFSLWLLLACVWQALSSVLHPYKETQETFRYTI